MKEYVFFVKKRTLRLQRKSVKIAEKVQGAPIFLQKELANRLPDVVTLRWISKSNAIDMIYYTIKLKHDVVDGAVDYLQHLITKTISVAVSTMPLRDLAFLTFLTFYAVRPPFRKKLRLSLAILRKKM